MSSLITISTRELQADDPNLNPSDFVVNFANPIELGTLKYELALYSFVGWNTVDNLTGTISYTIDAAPFVLNIPAGLYGVEDVNALLQADVVGNGGTSGAFQILPNYSTDRVEIQIDNTTHTYTYNLTAANNISDFLGFTPAVISSTTVGDLLPNVNGSVDSFQIECDLLRNSYVNGRLGKILYSFTPNYSVGSQIREQPVNLVFFQVNKSQINSIAFKMTDNLGNTLSFGGNHLVIQIQIRPIRG